MGKLLMFLLLVGIALSPAPGAWAQDDDEPAENQRAQRIVVISDQQFDAWVYGTQGRGIAQRRLETLLQSEIDEIARACDINAAQKQKLELAGRGDLKRYFDRVEDERQRFRNSVQTDPNALQVFVQEVQPLQAALRMGLFDESSFFAKARKTVLTEPQLAAYEKAQRDQRLMRHRVQINALVAQMDRTVHFREEQRQKFTAVLLEQIEPPKRFTQYDRYLLLLQAAKLPRAKVMSIFDESQWISVNQYLSRGLAFEPVLRQNGLLVEPRKMVMEHGHEH